MRTQSKAFAKALAAAGALALAVVASAPAQAFDIVRFTVDKRGAAEKAGSIASDLQKLGGQKIVYIDIKLLLDAGSRNALLSSEEQDPSRTNVECQAGAYGPLPMYEGLEYFFQSSTAAGSRVAVSLYPGSRTANPDNDVSCISDGGNPAVVRIRGIYRVSANPEGSNLRLDLRPLTRSSLTAKDAKRLP
jgi:hypothetical protein